MAIFILSSFKSPGPDGFHPIFYQMCWDKVGELVCSLILNSFQGNLMPKNLNNTLICLIPKVYNPESIKQFRPISLCNTVYVTIYKLIAQ